MRKILFGLIFFSSFVSYSNIMRVKFIDDKYEIINFTDNNKKFAKIEDVMVPVMKITEEDKKIMVSFVQAKRPLSANKVVISDSFGKIAEFDVQTTQELIAENEMADVSKVIFGKDELYTLKKISNGFGITVEFINNKDKIKLKVSENEKERLKNAIRYFEKNI